MNNRSYWTAHEYADNYEKESKMVRPCHIKSRSTKDISTGHGGGRAEVRQAREEMGMPYQGMDRPQLRPLTEGKREPREVAKSGCDVISISPNGHSVKGDMRVNRDQCRNVCWLLA